jgi:hypothetical protein
MFLKANPEEMLTIGESAGFGAVTGAGAGLICGLLNILINVMFGAAIATLMANFPGAERTSMLAPTTLAGVMSILMIPITMAIYAGFGALATSLGMQLFFKDRISRP